MEDVSVEDTAVSTTPASLLQSNGTVGRQGTYGATISKYSLTTSELKAIGVLYWFVFVIGTLGNLLVLVVLLSRQGRKAAEGHHVTSRVFLISLATADLVLHLTSTWLEAYEKTGMASSGWEFGEGYCKLNTFCRSFVCHTSVFTLTAIAIERYLVISRPSKRVITYKRAVVICVCIWLFNFLTNSPYLLWVEIVKRGPTLRCSWTNAVDVGILKRFAVATRITNLFIPLTITWLSYGNIVYIMYKSSKKVASEASSNSASTKSTWRVARMCLIVVMCFTVTWTPMHAAVLYITFVNRSSPLRYLATTLMTIFYFLASLNACLNPIIYGTLWRPFRQALYSLIPIKIKADFEASQAGSNHAGQAKSGRSTASTHT